ncbi:MAG: tetratricopeptide repeat protein [Candidatus Paceibacterota bacterium]
MNFDETVTFIQGNWAVILAAIVIIAPICWFIINYLYKNRIEELNAKNDKLQFELDNNWGESDKNKHDEETKEKVIDKQSKDEDSKEIIESFEKGVAKNADSEYNVDLAFESFEKGEYESGLKLFEASYDKEKSNISKNDLLAYGQYTAFVNGSNKAFEDLKQKLYKNPNDSNIAIWLALCYQHIEEFESGLKVLEKVLNKISNETEIVSVTIHVCNLLKELGEDEKIYERLRNVYLELTLLKEKARILENIGRYFEKKGEIKKAVFFFERALVHNYADTSLRFDLAYLYTNNSAPKFALYHYKKLLEVNEDHASSLNNSGVALENLLMPILSTKYYKDAVKKGNTLSSANLAYKLLKVGFIEESEEILKEAEKKDDIHDNVYSALADISKQHQKEKDDLKKTIKDVDKIRKWRHEFGNASLNKVEDLKKISGEYFGKPGKLKIEINDSGSVTGTIKFPDNEEPAQFNGKLTGAGIKFTWKEVQKKKKDENKDSLTGLSRLLAHPLPPRKETGLLIYSNQRLKGFSAGGDDSLDPDDSSSWTNWDLEKK